MSMTTSEATTEATTEPATETAAEIRAALAAAQIPASEAEIARLAPAHPPFRAAVRALYAVPEARYVDPAVRFRAEARVVDWG